MTAPSDFAVRAWARLERGHRAAQGTVEARLKAAGLPTLAWYDALLELERAAAAGLRPFELQHEMLFAQYNLSRLIDRLVEARCVARAVAEADGRGVVLTITPTGRALRRRMWPIYAAAIDEAVGRHLTNREAETLGNLLGKLYGA